MATPESAAQRSSTKKVLRALNAGASCVTVRVQSLKHAALRVHGAGASLPGDVDQRPASDLMPTIGILISVVVSVALWTMVVAALWMM